MSRREIEHNDFNQRTLNLESRIYDEASTGTTWYAAGTHAGLTGHHLHRVNMAMRLARSYARMYRQEWPPEGINDKDGKEAFLRGRDGADWATIALELNYTSPTEAQNHAVAYAERHDNHNFLEQCARARQGSAPYKLRDAGMGWDEVARQTGIPVRDVRGVAESYAKSQKLPWPILVAARQQEAERAAKAARAYSLRADSEKEWADVAADLGWSHNTIRELAREHATVSNLPWPIVLNPITQEERLGWGKQAYEKRLNDRTEWEVIGELQGLAPSTVYKWARIYAEECKLQWPLWTADVLGEACYAKKLELDSSWDEVAKCFNVSAGHASYMARVWAETNSKPWPLPKKGSLSAEKAYRLRADQKQRWPDIGKCLEITANTALSAAAAYAAEHGLPWPLPVERDIGPDAYQMRVDTQDSWLEIGQKFGVTVGHVARKASQHARETGKPWPLPAKSRPPFALGEQAYAIRRDEHPEWETIGTRLGVSKSTAMEHAREWAASTGHVWPIPTQDTERLAYDLRLQCLTWPQVAQRLQRDSGAVMKAAREHARENNLPWPPQVVVKPQYRDTPGIAYKMRSEQHLEWEEIAKQLEVSVEFLFRRTREYARTNSLPWPIEIEDPQPRQAYEWRVEGKGWAEIAAVQETVPSVVMDRARRFSEQYNLLWPPAVRPVRNTHSEKAKQAYELGYVQKKNWANVAAQLGYSSQESCRNSAKSFAKHSGLPYLVRKRTSLPRDAARQAQAYELKRDNPHLTWAEVSKNLKYRAPRAAHTAALQHARAHNLPWPLP